MEEDTGYCLAKNTRNKGSRNNKSEEVSDIGPVCSTPKKSPNKLTLPRMPKTVKTPKTPRTPKKKKSRKGRVEEQHTDIRTFFPG